MPRESEKFRKGSWLVVDLAEKAVTAAVVDAAGCVSPCIHGRGEAATCFFSSEIFLQGGPYCGGDDSRLDKLLTAMDGLDRDIWPKFELLGWLKAMDAASGRDGAFPDPLGMASRFAWDGEDLDKAERLGVLVHLFVLSPVEEVARQLNGGGCFAGAALILSPCADRLNRTVVRKSMRRLGFEHVLLLERDHALAMYAHFRHGALEANCLSIEDEGLRITRIGLDLAKFGLECRTVAGAWLEGAGWKGFAASVAEAAGQVMGAARLSTEEAERALLGLICGVGTARGALPQGTRLTFNCLEDDWAKAWQTSYRKRLSTGLANLEQELLVCAGVPAVGWGLPFALESLAPLLGQYVYGEAQGRFVEDTPFSERAVAGVAALLGRVLKGDGFAARLTSGQGLHLWSGSGAGVELVSGQALRLKRGERGKSFQSQRLEPAEAGAGNVFAARIHWGFGTSLGESATVGAWSGVIPAAALQCGEPLMVETEIVRDEGTGELNGAVVFSLGVFRGETTVCLPADEVLVGPVVGV